MVLKEILEQRDALQGELEQITQAVEAEKRDLSEAEETRSAELLAQIDEIDERVAQENRAAAKAELLAEARKRVQSVEARSSADGSQVNVSVESEAMVYGPDSRNSWWADQIALATRTPLDDRRIEAEARQREWSHQVEREIAHGTAKGKAAAKQFLDNESYRTAGKAAEKLAEARERGRVSLDAKTEQRTGITTGGGATASASGGGGAAFVSPVILALSDYAPYREYGRAFIDQANRQPLPEYGMEVYLPHVTGPAAVASQTEAGAVAETDPTFGYLSAGLITEAGQVTVSQQQLDRTGPGFAFDRMIFDQLERDYAPKVDLYTLNQVLAVATSQSYTGTFALSAASGSGGFYGQVSKAKAAIRTAAGTILNPTHLFMQPSRWEFIAAWADTQGRALVVPDYAGPFNALANSADGDAGIEGRTGARFNGLPVFADANIPNLGTTTTDQALVACMSEVWVFEGNPVHRVLPQTLGGNLQTILQRYSYIAVLVRYPAGIVSINGTAMTAPAYS